MQESAVTPHSVERRPPMGPEIARDAQGRSFGDFARLAEAARRHNEHAQEDAIRNLQVKFLYDRYKDKYKNILQLPREIKGFYFFEVNSENAKSGFKASEAVLGASAALEASPDGDRWKEIIDAHRSAIMGEYRINIRPKKDYVPAAIERLCELFAADPAMKDAVSSFKVKIGPSAPDLEKPENAFTEIVLYAKNDPEKDGKGRSGSRKALETLLPAVAAALQDLVPHAETSAIRRSSMEVNPLITVMQSGGDFRSLLKTVDKARGTTYFDEYFDEATNHAFAKGETLPETRPAQPRPPRPDKAKVRRDERRLDEARDAAAAVYDQPAETTGSAEMPAQAETERETGGFLSRLLSRFRRKP